MDTSSFNDKNIVPREDNLPDTLGDSYELWKSVHDYVHVKYPKAMDEWKFPGIKYGWHFRVKDKKRVIVYLLPRDKYFKITMGFGQKATDLILNTDVSDVIKDLLLSAKVYVEGRFISLDIRDHISLTDIRKLIDIKLT